MTTGLNTPLTTGQIEQIRQEYVDGRSMYWITQRYRIGAERAKKLLEGIEQIPTGDTGEQVPNHKLIEGWNNSVKAMQ